MLTDHEVIVARRCKDAVPQTLCRQDPALIIWNGERVPYHGEDYKPPSGDPEQQWDWGRPGCGVASGGAPQMAFPSDLDLISIANLG